MTNSDGMTPREVQDPTGSVRELTRFQQDVLVGTLLVPSNIEDLLSLDSIAVWLMDDGTAERSGVSFQTHSFGIDDVCLLARAMSARFGLETSVMRNKGAGIVYVHRKSMDTLVAMVGGKILPEFAYKLIPRGAWTP